MGGMYVQKITTKQNMVPLERPPSVPLLAFLLLPLLIGTTDVVEAPNRGDGPSFC